VQLIAGAKSSRLSRIQRTKDALAPAPDGFPWWQITEACEHLIRTLPELPTDQDDPEEIDEEAEDHAWEECGRFLEHRPIPPRVRPYSELDELDPHRARYGFGVGDKVGEGDVIAHHFPVGHEAKTLDDARQMAAAFAEAVS
jgi:hypothetical protein